MNQLEQTQLVRLKDATLDHLPEGISHPTYDRKNIAPGIVHVGLGNFHRAHQAWYLHRLMQQGKALDWGIIGAGVRSYDRTMRDRLLAQDCLTTLIELDPSGTSAEVIGSMIDYLPVEEGNGPLIAAMSDPRIRIVSLTVTEGGYFTDQAGQFDAAHPEMRHDTAHPDKPKSAFGAIVAALRNRRDADHGPITLQSCDNLQGNGEILKQTVLELAKRTDPALSDWIAKTCSFPNSMVDCIVPATGPSEMAMAKSLGIDDAAPVTHENFRQWVIEDDFCAGRPDWDKVGATFSSNVHAYEAMKIRILNAGHQVIANAAELLSIETIDQCMTHPLISALFHKVEAEGIVPYVNAVPEFSPADYVNLIAKRFANPAIRDTVRRVAFDGSARHSGFLVPLINEALNADGPVQGLALVEAIWSRMCAGTREDGSEIAPNDPIWEDLTTAALSAKQNPKSWLEQSRIYGNLASEGRFADAFEHWLTLIWQEGTEAALEHYVSS